jgi:hypothetical protein
MKVFRVAALVLTMISSAAVWAADSRTPADIDALSPAELEVLYWDCDFSTTQGMLGGSDAANCSFVFEKVKNVTFHGNFAAFMSWWRDHKDAEYAKRRGGKTT